MNVFPHRLIKFRVSSFDVLFRLMFYEVAGVEIGNIRAILPNYSLSYWTCHRFTGGVIQTYPTYCQIVDELLAPSDSCEINFFSTALTVVARGSTAQLPVLTWKHGSVSKLCGFRSVIPVPAFSSVLATFLVLVSEFRQLWFIITSALPVGSMYSYRKVGG